ncbi:MAG: hypothetical protein AAB473_05025 [Patescibacteria group bacterium]
MSLFDIFRRAGAEHERKFTGEEAKIQAETGARFIVEFLDSIDKRGKDNDDRMTMTHLRARADFIRAGLVIWDSLAVNEPQVFTPERKLRIGELLHKAMEEK